MREGYEAKYLDVGKRIAFYRQKRDMSQKELGGKIKCSLQEVQQIEGDYLAKRQPFIGIWSVKNLDFLFTIADVLKVDFTVFFLPMNNDNFEKYRTDREGR